MYPRDFFETYWRPALRDEVFVAMSFHPEFTSIWEQAIRPAIEVAGGGHLLAHRTDATTLSGSVLVEILDSIAHARVILADISVCEEQEKWRGQRNGNVMYEVGLAHAIRQSTEVVLIRSDDQEINFDLAGIKIYRYEKTDLVATRDLVAYLVSDALKQIAFTKSLKVEQAIQALDMDGLWYIREFGNAEAIAGPKPKTRGDELSLIPLRNSISRLLSLGILRYVRHEETGLDAYTWTPFGRAVLQKLRSG